jgi:ER lumen protein retaining receptor
MELMVLVGISFKTQLLYFTVFAARYADLFTHFVSLYNTAMKLFFIASSGYIIYQMNFRFRPTYDSSLDTFKIEYLIVFAVVLAIIFHVKLTVLEVRSIFLCLKAANVVKCLCNNLLTYMLPQY